MRRECLPLPCSMAEVLVEITYTGYSTIVETVEINGDVQKDFTMQEAGWRMKQLQ